MPGKVIKIRKPLLTRKWSQRQSRLLRIGDRGGDF